MTHAHIAKSSSGGAPANLANFQISHKLSLTSTDLRRIQMILKVCLKRDSISHEVNVFFLRFFSNAYH